MTTSAAVPIAVQALRPTLPTDRFWKIDYAKIEFPPAPAECSQTRFTIDDAAIAQGVILCTLEEALQRFPERVAIGLRSSVADDETRFTTLASTVAESGFFCFVPAGIRVNEPLTIEMGHHDTWFGRGVIVVESNAEVSIIEKSSRYDAATFISAVVEIVLADHAKAQYTAIQDCAPTARSFVTRRALVAADATITYATAELGASLAQSYVDARLLAPGAHAEIATVVFADEDRYLGNDLEHTSPNTTSNTVVKAVALDKGRGRYYGNIRIKPQAHGSEASLRDDTLLLSREAHIDSVPALEIAANDVKAFHGATVGSVDAEQLFYTMSRGLSRIEAERMITLGFFEPAIARFPLETVREFLRTQLAERVGRD